MEVMEPLDHIICGKRKKSETIWKRSEEILVVSTLTVKAKLTICICSVPLITTNVLKPGISEEFFANYWLYPSSLPTIDYIHEINNRWKLPEPKIKDLREMLPFMRPSARQFYESELAHNTIQAYTNLKYLVVIIKSQWRFKMTTY